MVKQTLPVSFDGSGARSIVAIQVSVQDVDGLLVHCWLKFTGKERRTGQLLLMEKRKVKTLWLRSASLRVLVGCCPPLARSPGSGWGLVVWNRWASSHTSQRCACTGIYSPVYDSSWLHGGYCPPGCHTCDCSPAPCGKRTGGKKVQGNIRQCCTVQRNKGCVVWKSSYGRLSKMRINSCKLQKVMPL